MWYYGHVYNMVVRRAMAMQQNKANKKTYKENEMTIKIVTVFSGKGTTIKNLVDKITSKELNVEIVGAICVAQNKYNYYGKGVCSEAGIQVIDVEADLSIRDRSNEAFHALNYYRQLKGVDLVVFCGLLYKVMLTEEFPGINIHPSLLPKHGGKDMYGEEIHKSVYNAEEDTSGCTAHWVTNDYNIGKYIIQREINIINDNGRRMFYPIIQKKVKELENEVLPEAIVAAGIELGVLQPGQYKTYKSACYICDYLLHSEGDSDECSMCNVPKGEMVPHGTCDDFKVRQ